MLDLLWSDAIQRAFFDTWIHEAEMPDALRNERVGAFVVRWGGIDIDAFKRALRDGKGTDRLFAIFALSYLALSDVEELLVPFLHSSVRKARWASAIVLGESKRVQAFVPLQDALIEDMECHPPHTEKDLMRIVYEAANEAVSRFGSRADWERVVDPALLAAWNEQQAYLGEYRWHLIHRLRIAHLLGTWEDPRAIPVLRQALRMCWEVEQLPRFHGRPSGGSEETWHQLEDNLAYTLGQLEAWNALDGLDLPSLHFQLARMFLVFGSLHVNLRYLYDGNITRLITIGTIDPDLVIRILQERFGLTRYKCESSLQQFQQWYQERARKFKQASSTQ
jgi:hypothetical protein